jgi:hypothetical protein
MVALEIPGVSGILNVFGSYCIKSVAYNASDNRLCIVSCIDERVFFENIFALRPASVGGSCLVAHWIG